MPAETAANTIQTAAPRTNEAGRAVPGAGQWGCIGLRRQPQYLLAHSPGGIALYAGIDNWPATQRNLARYLFLHPAAREVFSDRDNQIRGCVARLRALALRGVPSGARSRAHPRRSRCPAHRDRSAPAPPRPRASAMDLTARHPRTGELLSTVKFTVATLAAVGELQRDLQRELTYDGPRASWNSSWNSGLGLSRLGARPNCPCHDVPCQWSWSTVGSEAPAPTKPRRLSMRSMPLNSVSTAAVRSGAHGS